MKDFVQIATDYALKVISDADGKFSGYYLRQAAKRFLDDLDRAGKDDCDFIFDPFYANDACDFIEKLPHVEGIWETPTIVLHDSHVFFVVQLFGFRSKKSYKVDGEDYHPRRFTSALFAVSRKNAKSTLSAGIMLYCFCCEPEPGAQVISAATTYPQASIIFNIAKRMVEKTPEMRDYFGIDIWAKSITRVDTGASFKPIHAKASTQDGLNPSHVALDEIHAHKTGDLLNVLTSAAGARPSPLFLYTTTEGYSNPGPWADLRLFAKKLLSGLFEGRADHFLVVYYAIDNADKNLGIQGDDDFDESKWIKANPLMDVNPYLMQSIRKEAIEAKQMPSKMAEFRIKRLNRPASTSDGFIDLLKWEKCNEMLRDEELSGFNCYGGLDLASTRDIAAFRLIWDVDGMIYTKGWRFVPESAVKSRTERGSAPYAGWVESGELIVTAGDVVDYAEIERIIREKMDYFNVISVGYDQWNATDLVKRLTDDGYVFEPFVQGTKSFHPTMQFLDIAYNCGKIGHGGDPVLTWCASNLVARMDINMSMAPDRKNSADKIDDMVALLMAIGRLLYDSDDTANFEHMLRNPL